MAAAAVPLLSRRRSGGRSVRRVSDDRLVAAVRAGDDAAFEAIYDRYYLGLLAFCRHMLGGRHEAEDALQHSFASAYRAMRGGDAVIELRPWLYTIARNRCLSALRSHREEVEVDGGELDRGSLDGLGAQIQRRAELRELVDDLQRLREDQRAALVLFELGDHSHEEIAAVLGVRREKVKALVFQARAGLLRAREARDASCVDVREQLSSVVGGLPSRGMARAHVERCPGCAAFEHEVRRQRAALAAILPVVPSMGLKASVLSFALGGGGGAALTGAGGGATVVAGGAVAAGGAGGGGAVGVAGALGTAGAATVAGSLATGTANVATGVAGATAKGLVAKILAVVAVAGGTGDVQQSASQTPVTPMVTAGATPALGVKAPGLGADTPSQDPATGLAHGAPAPASQGAPADPVVQATAPPPDPAPADPVPTAAPAPAPEQAAPQPTPAPAAADPEPTPAPEADTEPASTTPDASPAAEASMTTASTSPAGGTPAATPPSAAIGSTPDATVTTMSTPDPSPAPPAASAQAQQ
jgi:RNA polymerase sigma factor (sigma-70 family)